MRKTIAIKNIHTAPNNKIKEQEGTKKQYDKQ